MHIVTRGADYNGENKCFTVKPVRVKQKDLFSPQTGDNMKCLKVRQYELSWFVLQVFLVSMSCPSLSAFTRNTFSFLPFPLIFISLCDFRERGGNGSEKVGFVDVKLVNYHYHASHDRLIMALLSPWYVVFKCSPPLWLTSLPASSLSLNLTSSLLHLFFFLPSLLLLSLSVFHPRH